MFLTMYRVLFLVCLLLAQPAARAGWLDKEIRFTEQDIQANIDRNPLPERRINEFLSIGWIGSPRISLGRPQADRVGLQARVELFVLGSRGLPVDLTGTAGIRYDDAQKAFFLQDPVVDHLDSPGLGPDLKPAAQRAVGNLLKQYFRTRPIHVLREDGHPTEAMARWLLRSVRIEPGQVVAVLSPLQ